MKQFNRVEKERFNQYLKFERIKATNKSRSKKKNNHWKIEKREMKRRIKFVALKERQKRGWKERGKQKEKDSERKEKTYVL